jgi:hypothetical protein
MSTQNLEELKIPLNLKCFTKVYGKRFIFAGARRSVHSSGHHGYTKMLERFKEMKGFGQVYLKIL